MSLAISALAASLAVIYVLSLTSTTTQPADTYFRILINLLSGQSRQLTADEALTALTYSVLVYLMTFSASFFIFRFLGSILLALGVPDEEMLRRSRELRRNDATQLALQRRQARLNAQYMLRAQSAAQRRSQRNIPSA
jgi:hypothetical protein